MEGSSSSQGTQYCFTCTLDLLRRAQGDVLRSSWVDAVEVGGGSASLLPSPPLSLLFLARGA